MRKPISTSDTGRSRKATSGAAMFSELAWGEIARSLKLSGRELQIVRAVFDDRTEFAIAADLRISPHTVHTHIERLHRKLAVVDRSQLILCVMSEFLMLTIAPGTNLPSICANRTAGRCPLLIGKLSSAPSHPPARRS
jgi:DNA-binding CsgD family transcriptional regulator